jgi:hypothetical protein
VTWQIGQASSNVVVVVVVVVVVEGAAAEDAVAADTRRGRLLLRGAVAQAPACVRRVAAFAVAAGDAAEALARVVVADE